MLQDSPAQQSPAQRRPSPARTNKIGPLFRGVSTGAGVMILVTLAAVVVFLLLRAWPALTASQEELAAIS